MLRSAPAAAVGLAERGGTGLALADTGSVALSFTDVDLTDHHTATAAAPTAVWSGSATLPSGLIAALTGALTPTVIDSTNTGAGLVAAAFWAPDATFDFLATGETLTITYLVTADDAHTGGTSTQPVTITVTGTNDARVIATDTTTHALTEASGVTGGGTTNTATGTLSFTDVDLKDTHTLTKAFASAVVSGGGGLPAATNTALASALTATLADGAGSGSVNFSFSLADSLADFLAEGQTLTVTYNVTVSDTHGGSSAKPVTFTITGTNDLPVLSAATTPELILNGGFESGAASWPNVPGTGGVEVHSAGTYGVSGASGSVLEIDANGGLPLDDVSQTVTTVAGGTYTFAFDAAQRSGFAGATNPFQVLFNGVLIDTVTPGSTAMEHHSYTVQSSGTTGVVEFKETSSDGAGGIVDNVSLKPTTALLEQSGVFGASAVDATKVVLTFTDVDLSDTATAVISAPTAALSGGGSVPAGLVTALTGALTAPAAKTGASGSLTASFSAARGLQHPAGDHHRHGLQRRRGEHHGRRRRGGRDRGAGGHGGLGLARPGVGRNQLHRRGPEGHPRRRAGRTELRLERRNPDRRPDHGPDLRGRPDAGSLGQHGQRFGLGRLDLQDRRRRAGFPRSRRDLVGDHQRHGG